MDCFEAEMIMLKELEGTATDRETDRLISHLLSCPDCCRHFRFLKSVLTENNRQEIQERETAAVPKDFEVQVMMKIRNINAVTVVKTRVKYR